MEHNIRSVLIIHNDPSVARVVTATLRRDRCSVTVTKDAVEGLTLARDLNPDVLLCDVELPKLTGPQVIELLKSNPATSRIPVVLMSGSSDAHEFLQTEWAAFLGKPFSGTELMITLQSAVSKRTPTVA